jgi:hypothetical protein
MLVPVCERSRNFEELPTAHINPPEILGFAGNLNPICLKFKFAILQPE